MAKTSKIVAKMEERIFVVTQIKHLFENQDNSKKLNSTEKDPARY
jgi:hypothetical protein